MKIKKRSRKSNDEKEEEDFPSEYNFKTSKRECLIEMVHGSKKKRAHPDSYVPPPTVSTPPVTSISLAATSTPPTAASTPPVTSTLAAAASTLLVTFASFLQLPYSRLSPIPISSSSASAIRASSRPTPSSSAPLPRLGFVDACPPITPHSKSFSKQSACAKIISETIKQQLVEAHPSFERVPDSINNT
ncbi:hypothetical protein M9H77_16781 [Catharanthus roseus]|uniref:Uncharacterized protein n=1 Tax=Catharanthus roseus TaxID=4058 RepID=A0ACC0B2S0_CATRO|nr:hypothetical protein M9H77_16781 [Catharanthus roseus]